MYDYTTTKMQYAYACTIYRTSGATARNIVTMTFSSELSAQVWAEKTIEAIENKANDFASDPMTQHVGM